MLSDEALYERLLAGDLSAFDALYERHARHLFGFILRHLDDRPEAEDLLHDAFLALLRERQIGQRKISFRAWLFQVARNLCLNRLRSRKRMAHAMAVVEHEPEASSIAPDQAVNEHQARAALKSALGELPAPQSELFHLRSGGLSYEEMAEVLAVPVGTVKSRMHELVQRLREEMRR
jgi:RNA polymerase sigma-70 factor, ECF subfamily